MRFILHIGLPKTGTTAIQKFLYDNRKKLLEEHSVLYPKTGISGLKYPAHYFIPHSLFPAKREEHKKNLGVDLEVSVLRQQIFDEISEHQPKVVILSCEDFFHFTQEKIYEFKDLYDFPVTNVICYIRRQDLAAESMYRQNVKAEVTKLTKHFTEYTTGKISKYIKDTVSEIHKLNYYTLLSNWKQAFPEAKIIPRVYDRKLFPEGNVILDFLSVLGIDMPEAREYKIEVNPSLSHLSTLVMRRINEEFNLSNEDHWKVVDYLLKLDREEGSSIIKTFFTLQERIEFLNRFKESNERLFREYFGCENKFVLSEEEIKFYKEQDKIPKEVIEKAIEERYRKVLEFMKASGILMKEKLFPKVKVNYLPNNRLEFFRVDVLHANLLNGRLTVGGLALLRRDIEETPKLTIKDAEGMKEVQWGIPSPLFGEQRKDNPRAKNARFRIDNIVVGDKPIEIYLDEEKIAEILIESRSSKKIGPSSGENNSAGGQRANDVQKGKRVSWLRKLLRF